MTGRLWWRARRSAGNKGDAVAHANTTTAAKPLMRSKLLPQSYAAPPSAVARAQARQCERRNADGIPGAARARDRGGRRRGPGPAHGLRSAARAATASGRGPTLRTGHGRRAVGTADGQLTTARRASPAPIENNKPRAPRRPDDRRVLCVIPVIVTHCCSLTAFESVSCRRSCKPVVLRLLRLSVLRRSSNTHNNNEVSVQRGQCVRETEDWRREDPEEVPRQGPRKYDDGPNGVPSIVFFNRFRLSDLLTRRRVVATRSLAVFHTHTHTYAPTHFRFVFSPFSKGQCRI